MRRKANRRVSRWKRFRSADDQRGNVMRKRFRTTDDYRRNMMRKRFRSIDDRCESLKRTVGRSQRHLERHRRCDWKIEVGAWWSWEDAFRQLDQLGFDRLEKEAGAERLKVKTVGAFNNGPGRV
ncbi:hypothetical protein LWI28_016617 [Acer negundo]|uniref:Uncharacterized protein n=1 Tax=Acer negundo TaxID=4023 RepID=A0AAD5IRI3_ACENE|nr:hypothetical protein LWI28_016617 [Acer negundo]